MGLIRILTTVRQTATHTFYADGVPTDATGDVTATLRRLDGTLVETLVATHTGTGVYTYSIPPSALVDILTLDWSGDVAGATIVARDIVEVVGGFYWTLTEARNSHPSLRDTSKHSWEALAAKRIQVEWECERIRRQAQVPRFARFRVDGTGNDQLIVPDMELRAVRAVTVDGIPYTTTVAATQAGVIATSSGVWPRGDGNVIVEYEYGLDQPDPSIVDASLQRLRYLLAQSRSGIPDRALSWTTAEGGTYRLTTAGPKSTGDPDVDAAYKRDANERVWIA